MLWRQFHVILASTRATSSPALATKSTPSKETNFETSFFSTRLLFFHPYFLTTLPFLKFPKEGLKQSTKIVHARLLLPSLRHVVHTHFLVHCLQNENTTFALPSPQ
jgi:hypothetical protein